MDESAKYLIHADVTASGVVEREDVVGAVYGQTEGLLGDELDLRYLQESSKVGRIDVDVDSEGGRSFGELTIATSMDRVETAVLAASLETIGRIGPCRSEVRVTAIEDVRAAKRREVVERAKELLAESFDEAATSSREILEEVRRAVRVEDITEYEGLPAGPNVGDSDAVVVVEGRADVLQLLQYGVKNAVAVEGTDVPEAVAELTHDRTVTAFLDGDRGGDLILKELAQIGEVDYVAIAPPDRSVEDLSRGEVMSALREKVPYEMLDEQGPGAPVPTDGGTLAGAITGTDPQPASASDADRDADADPGASDTGPDGEPGDGPAASGGSGAPTETPAAGAVDPAGTAGKGSPGEQAGDDRGAVGDVASRGDAAPDEADAAPDEADVAPDEADVAPDEADVAPDEADAAPGQATETTGTTGTTGTTESAGTTETSETAAAAPETLPAHVAAVVGESTGTVRLLDAGFAVLAEAPAEAAFETLEGADPVPAAVVLDGTLTQRVLDVAAQRGVGQVVARAVGDLVKQPVGVRVRTADQLQ